MPKRTMKFHCLRRIYHWNSAHVVACVPKPNKIFVQVGLMRPSIFFKHPKFLKIALFSRQFVDRISDFWFEIRKHFPWLKKPVIPSCGWLGLYSTSSAISLMSWLGVWNVRIKWFGFDLSFNRIKSDLDEKKHVHFDGKCVLLLLAVFVFRMIMYISELSVRWWLAHVAVRSIKYIFRICKRVMRSILRNFYRKNVKEWCKIIMCCFY